MYDFAASGATRYPAMAVELTPNSYSRNMLVQSFNVYLMDLVTKDIRNRQEVLSDMQLVCLDVLALMDRDTRYDWAVTVDNITLNDFVDRFDDEVSGYWFRLDVKTKAPLDKCAVPLLRPVNVLSAIAEQTINASAFITTWKTDNTGTSEDTQITIPLGSAAVPSTIIDWGDDKVSVITSYNQNELTHTYSTAGTYTVKMYGAYDHIYFNNGGDKLKILSIEQWGTSLLKSLNNSYTGCANLVGRYSDKINIKSVKLEFTFFGAIVFNGANMLEDGTAITGMERAFDTTRVNFDLSGWEFSGISNGSDAIFCFRLNTIFSTENYDLWLLALDRDVVSNARIGASSTSYTTAVSGTARANLVGRGCTITDAGGI